MWVWGVCMCDAVHRRSQYKKNSFFFIFERTFHGGHVLPLHVGGRVQEPLRQLPVPREEQEARGVRVETAHGVKRLLQARGQCVLQVGPAPGVAHGGVHVQGLVVRDEEGQGRDGLVLHEEEEGGGEVDGGVPGCMCVRRGLRVLDWIGLGMCAQVMPM